MLSSPQFCDTCGAANRAQALFCRVCGQSLRAPVNAGNTSSASVSSTINITGNSSLTGLLTQRSMLKQRYIILSQAGRGGFGAVYKASDTQFGNRLVAIKEMSQNTLDAQEFAEAMAAFKREAMLLAGLTHPNLPRIYEQFTDTGRSYLVMDFIEGTTLEELLAHQHGKKLALDQVLEIALQLCSVLDYLHTRQPPIIFRDLKPANVMLTSNGHVYLIDFGIARLFKPGQSKDTTALGSTGYASPEQYGRSQTTARADIYSLGATLHQMITGDDPTETPFQFAPLKFPSPPLSSLDTLIMSMVSVDITKRPASIAVVRQELQRIATQYMLGQTHPFTSSTLSHTLPGISASLTGKQPIPFPNLPANPYQTVQAPKTPRKRTGQPQVYPQANTLYVCLGHTSRITSIAWSPNGAYLASACYDKTVRLWQAANGKHIFIYREHSARVNAVSWSPDSKYLATASDDHTVQIWEATTGRAVLPAYTHSGPVSTVSWSPDGTLIASAGTDKGIHVWDAQTHIALPSTPYRDHTDKINVVAWSPDSRALASAGKDTRLSLWEPLKIQQKRSFFNSLFFPNQGHKTLFGHGGQIYTLAWSPDGTRIASATSVYGVNIWDVFAERITCTFGPRSATIKNSVAWSPDGKYLAIGGNDKTVHIYNVSLQKEAFTYSGHAGFVMSVAWSPDGTRIASAGVDRSIQVWQAT